MYVNTVKVQTMVLKLRGYKKSFHGYLEFLQFWFLIKFKILNPTLHVPNKKKFERKPIKHNKCLCNWKEIIYLIWGLNLVLNFEA